MRLVSSLCKCQATAVASGKSEIKLEAAWSRPYSLSRCPEAAWPLTHWCLLKPFQEEGRGLYNCPHFFKTDTQFPFHNLKGTLGGISVIPEKSAQPEVSTGDPVRKHLFSRGVPCGGKPRPGKAEAWESRGPTQLRLQAS